MILIGHKYVSQGVVRCNRSSPVKLDPTVRLLKLSYIFFLLAHRPNNVTCELFDLTLD